MARMNVVFEDELLQEMRELVPVRQRSEFIEEAVRLRLAQLRQVRAAEAAAGAWSGEDRGEPSREIEEIRRAWEARQRRSDPGRDDG
jgi:Arc/MetJ-type ribon-helix-helix transcriptional regulator